MKGIFITLEGGEGCGKSTQSARLCEYLKQNGVPYVLTREPGGSKIAEQIRQIILDGKNVEMCDECEALLYAASRVQHLKEVVAPALAQGKVVVCDRYVDSSLAYQGYARGLGFEFIERINAYALQNYTPDVTLFFDISPQEAFARKHGADKDDRLEQAGMAFHERVYQGFQLLAEKYPRIVKLDCRKSIDEVAQDIVSVLKQKGIVK